jgi:hypothetical protein
MTFKAPQVPVPQEGSQVPGKTDVPPPSIPQSQCESAQAWCSSLNKCVAQGSKCPKMEEMLPIISSKEESSKLPEGANVNTATGTTLIPMESLMNGNKDKESEEDEPLTPQKPGKTDVPPPSSKAEVTDCGMGMKWCGSYERCINTRRECPPTQDESMMTTTLQGVSSKMEVETLKNKGQVRPCPGALTWCPAYDTCFPPQLCPRGSKPEELDMEELKKFPVRENTGEFHLIVESEDDSEVLYCNAGSNPSYKTKYFTAKDSHLDSKAEVYVPKKAKYCAIGYKWCAAELSCKHQQLPCRPCPQGTKEDPVNGFCVPLEGKWQF